MRCIKDVEVGTRMRNLRLDTGAKMIDVAIEFDISMAQYSRLESGLAKISVDVLGKACNYYNCSIDYILFGQKNSCESVFFQKLQSFDEKDIRRFLKILCCLLDMKGMSSQCKTEPMYKIFVGGLLEMIPYTASNAMPYVLEYEKNLSRKSENAMIEELGLTRFKWNSIMRGTRVSDITIPLAISNQYGYDMNFLINNKLTESLYFDDFFYKLKTQHQENVMKLFDDIIKIEGQELIMEVQKKKWDDINYEKRVNSRR